MQTGRPQETSAASAEARFGFGRNWRRFLSGFNLQRLQRACDSLREFWPAEQTGLRFLDAGSGSGAFSLAARQLGAEVVSFDYDADSVACTQALREQYFPGDSRWRVEQASVLDTAYLQSLGTFDVVYSWGVLHHTGQMRQALENIILPTRPGGLLVIAIYNDQGWKSRFWWGVKRIYCSGWLGRWLMRALFVPGFLLAFLAADLLRGRHPLARYRSRHDPRGMSVLTDILDWIGGFPFEVASVADIQTFYESRGFQLQLLKPTRSLGCNEFVFRRDLHSNN